MGAQVISTVRASVELGGRDLPVKHFVIGKTWGWKNKEAYTFIKSLRQIEKELTSGTLLYTTHLGFSGRDIGKTPLTPIWSKGYRTLHSRSTT